jgi:hypothetical protein
MPEKLKVDTTLVAMIKMAYDISIGKPVPPSYFAERGLLKEGRALAEAGLIELVTTPRKNAYDFTPSGREEVETFSRDLEILFEERKQVVKSLK